VFSDLLPIFKFLESERTYIIFALKVIGVLPDISVHDNIND